jgi:hypothetical protein
LGWGILGGGVGGRGGGGGVFGRGKFLGASRGADDNDEDGEANVAGSSRLLGGFSGAIGEGGSDGGGDGIGDGSGIGGLGGDEGGGWGRGDIGGGVDGGGPSKPWRGSLLEARPSTSELMTQSATAAAAPPKTKFTRVSALRPMTFLLLLKHMG